MYWNDQRDRSTSKMMIGVPVTGLRSVLHLAAARAPKRRLYLSGVVALPIKLPDKE